MIDGEELRIKDQIECKKYEIEKSYITKEEFINLISNTDFERIEYADLKLMTGLIADFGTGETKILSKRIEIRGGNK